MPTTDASNRSLDGSSEMFTVPEAARRAGHQLAASFIDGQPDGIPTIRVGRTLRTHGAVVDELVSFRRIAKLDEFTANVAVATCYLSGTPATGPGPQSGPRRRRCIAATGAAQVAPAESD
jgi:hypothetical protein